MVTTTNIWICQMNRNRVSTGPIINHIRVMSNQPTSRLVTYMSMTGSSDNRHIDDSIKIPNYL